MKKQVTLMKTFAAFCMAVSAVGANAQFNETMGTTGASTETIAVREANNRFSVTALTYSGTADVRNTTPSTGYAGSSGGYNVLVQAQETFEIRTINSSACAVTDSITFGAHKSTNASTGIDFLVLEYSVNSGTSWTSIPFAALPTGTGTSKWYRRAAALPAGAISPTLWIRFRSTLAGTTSANPQFRLDDVRMTCGSTADCSGLNASVATTDPSVFCAGGSALISLITNVASPIIAWYNQNGVIAGQTSASITASVSGTYYAVVKNAAGCEVKSGKQYVLSYPAPAFCAVNVSSCAGNQTRLCAVPNTLDLIISEYVEGSGFNKYLEIFNGTCDDVDMSNYELRDYHNGATFPTYVIPLSGIAVAGDVFVIADSAATIWTGTPNFMTDEMQFNGDDAIVLYNTTTGKVIDIFGSIGHDPGSAWRDNDTLSGTFGWRTENKTLVRKSCVYAGITVNPDLPGIGGFPTLVTEWDTLSVDDVSGLGIHNFGPSSYSFSVVSGNSTVASSTGNECVDISVGTGVSVIAATPVYCTFNSCNVAVPVFTITDTCRAEGRTTAVSSSSSALKNAEVFPNPFTDVTTVVFEQEKEGKAVITVATLSGQVILTQAVDASAGKQRVELNTSELTAGTYVCNITTDKGSKTIRIVKMK